MQLNCWDSKILLLYEKDSFPSIFVNGQSVVARTRAPTAVL